MPIVNSLPLLSLVSCVDLFALFIKILAALDYSIENGFAALTLQYMENLSDRELARFLQENNAPKYFCGFDLIEKTPDHSYFSELRKKIGTARLAQLCNRLGDKLREKGLISNVFTFVDASRMVSKMALWDERDKAIAKGKPKKVTIVACMRKLLSMLHSLLKANRPFQLFLPQDSC